MLQKSVGTSRHWIFSKEIGCDACITMRHQKKKKRSQKYVSSFRVAISSFGKNGMSITHDNWPKRIKKEREENRRNGVQTFCVNYSYCPSLKCGIQNMRTPVTMTTNDGRMRTCRRLVGHEIWHRIEKNTRKKSDELGAFRLNQGNEKKRVTESARAREIMMGWWNLYMYPNTFHDNSSAPQHRVWIVEIVQAKLNP